MGSGERPKGIGSHAAWTLMHKMMVFRSRLGFVVFVTHRNFTYLSSTF
jgi:hypothetical protein